MLRLSRRVDLAKLAADGGIIAIMTSLLNPPITSPTRLDDALRGQGSLSEGVSLENGGRLRIIFEKKNGAASAQIVFGTLLLVVVVVDAPDLRSSLARLRARRTSMRQISPQVKPKAQGS